MESTPGQGPSLAPPLVASGRAAGRDRADLAILTACQFLFYMGVSVDLTLTAMAGLSLAPTVALATLPLSAMTVVAMVSNFAAGMLSTRFGHRKVLAAGAVLATVGGLMSMWAMEVRSFALLCAGTAVVGTYKATGGYFRYLAADRARPGRRERAVSTVLCGGVAAAILGPIAATACSDLLPAKYAGAYLLVSVLAAGVVPLVALVRSDRPAPGKETAAAPPAAKAVVPVPVRTAAHTSAFRIGLGALTVAGFVMTLLMAAGPLGSAHAGHSAADSALIIQWHMVGMFAPSLFSGRLNTRLGPRPTAILGGLILGVGALAGAAGTGMSSFVISLALIGVGWNILYVAGSAFVVRCYPPGAGGRIQAVVEGSTGIFATVASLSSAPLFTSLGWQTLNVLAALPPLALSLFLWVAPRPLDSSRET